MIRVYWNIFLACLNVLLGINFFNRNDMFMGMFCMATFAITCIAAISSYLIEKQR